MFGIAGGQSNADRGLELSGARYDFLVGHNSSNPFAHGAAALRACQFQGTARLACRWEHWRPQNP
jgi:hypothetical protein